MQVPVRHSGTNSQVSGVRSRPRAPTRHQRSVPDRDLLGDLARGRGHPAGRRRRPARGLLPQCRRLPDAAPSVGLDPPLVLSHLRPPAGVVGERAARVVAVPARSLPHVPRTDLDPVPPRRGDHGPGLRPRRLGMARHAPDRRATACWPPPPSASPSSSTAGSVRPLSVGGRRHRARGGPPGAGAPGGPPRIPPRRGVRRIGHRWGDLRALADRRPRLHQSLDVRPHGTARSPACGWAGSGGDPPCRGWRHGCSPHSPAWRWCAWSRRRRRRRARQVARLAPWG